MDAPQDYIGQRRLAARVESRHTIATGHVRELYRIELIDVRDESSGDRIWRRKTVSDGKKWNEVETGSMVTFDARLDFDRHNRVQIFNIRNVEVRPDDASPWWKLW